MQVHLVKEQTIADYAALHARSRSSFGIWLGVIRIADWSGPADIKRTFSTADLLGKSSNRVVFDIGGNNYIMICKYYFGENEVHLFVCWMGTHAEYGLLCVRKEQYTINKF